MPSVYVKRPPRHLPWQQRLWNYIRMAPGDGCWEWQRGKIKGYGVLKINGKTHLAHRLVFQLVNGETLSPEIQVCHRCDNPGCCRPDHLFSGTSALNHADMRAKNRQASTKGEIHGSAKLSESDVLDLRARAGESKALLAAEYGISDSTIRQVIGRETWRHI